MTVVADLATPVGLPVQEVRRLTATAVQLRLPRPPGPRWRHLPGQYLTVAVPVGGRELRRCYSLTSLPDDATLDVVVDRVDGGAVSTVLTRDLRPGDRLGVLPPAGRFTVDPTPTGRRHLVLVGGGSGITPLYAIARAVLDTEPRSAVTLVHGSRSAAQVVLRDEVAELARRHPGRFDVRHVLDEGPGFASARVGRLDPATTAALLRGVGRPDTAYYLCGPGPMTAMVRSALLDELGVDPEAVHVERFTPAAVDVPAGPAAATLTVLADGAGGGSDVAVAPGATLLDALEAAGIPASYSCRVGDCGTCKARLLTGEVAMDEPEGLLPEEEDAGDILLCVARPRSPRLAVALDR
jgi:ferredoxin-NADP reductase